MNNLTRYSNEKATVCSNNKCVTVYGQAAQTINTIAVVTALILAMAYIVKAFR